MSTRATNARHVRQRKLNTRQALPIIREEEIDDAAAAAGELDAQHQHQSPSIPQFETGVEKGEEVEIHLQAVINAAAAATHGAKVQEQNYIPTPEATLAKDVKYDDLYPKTFSQPATYIRFSSTVEDSVGANYCMNDADQDFLAKLNSGKIVKKDSKLGRCSEDTFEQVMDFFEETSARVQPYASFGDAPLLTLDEMKQNVDDENVSTQAQAWFDLIYKHHWAAKKEERPLMPAIKVRVLDQANDLDDADPYICFRRREQRLTRKTRGRDAQVVEKLKKLRLELEQARQLVHMVVTREELQKQNLEVSRKVFEQRRKLKEVKVTKQINTKDDNDEDLLVNQKAASKTKSRPDPSQPRPPTLRLMSRSQPPAADNDMDPLSDKQAQMDEYITNAIESRKEQHKKWNLHWVDRTWPPLTPPPDDRDEPQPKWAPLLASGTYYPSPPPSLPSDESRDKEKNSDVEMQDAPAPDPKADRSDRTILTPEPETIFYAPDLHLDVPKPYKIVQRDAAPVCRLRVGRGGRHHLEVRKQRQCDFDRGVVSDGDSDDDDDMPEYHPVPESKIFDYRCAVNSRARPEGMKGERRTWSSGDQSAMAVPPLPPSQQANIESS
nr:enhancer of polycomb-like protein 1 [Quercus suber]